MKRIEIFIISTLVLECFEVATSADYERCEIDDDECWRKTANFLIQNFPKGNSDVGLPSMDPLLIEKLSLIQDLNAVKIEAHIYNTVLTGLKNVTKLVKSKNGTVLMEILIPKSSFIGPYKVKGQLLKLPIEGQGNLVVNITNSRYILKFSLDTKTIDNKKYFVAINPKMSLSVTGGKVYLSHLGRIAHSFINWSFVTIVNAVSDSFCKPMSLIFLEKINSVFEKTPIDELFLS